MSPTFLEDSKIDELSTQAITVSAQALLCVLALASYSVSRNRFGMAPKKKFN